MITTTIDKETQSALTPDNVIDDLIQGNQRFVKDSMQARAYQKQRESTKGTKQCTTTRRTKERRNCT